MPWPNSSGSHSPDCTWTWQLGGAPMGLALTLLCALDGPSSCWHSSCSSPFSTVLAPSLIFSGGHSHFLCLVRKPAPKTAGDDDLDLASVWTRWVSALGAEGSTRWKVSKGCAVRLPRVKIRASDSVVERTVICDAMILVHKVFLPVFHIILQRAVGF